MKQIDFAHTKLVTRTSRKQVIMNALDALIAGLLLIFIVGIILVILYLMR